MALKIFGTSHSLRHRFVVHLTPQANAKNLFVFCVFFFLLFLVIAKVIDTLDLYAPALKGLTDVHAYACETLESIIFDQRKADQRGQAAAFLYGTFLCRVPGGWGWGRVANDCSV